MRRYLVVANRTLGGERLLEQLRQRVEAGSCSLHVLVPASPDQQGWTHDENLDRERARLRMELALERFGELGCEVTGEIGDPRPVDAVLDVMLDGEYDEILLSTLPTGASRWLGMDTVSRVQRAVSVPVVHVEAEETMVSID